jgi:hypothetical protein
MKHLNRYTKFFSLLKEQQATAGPEAIAAGKDYPDMMPEWFKKGFYGEGKGRKFGVKNMQDAWNVAAKYIDVNKINPQNMKELQLHMWKNINMKQGNEDDAKTVLQLLNDVRTKGGKPALTDKDVNKFADGKYGTQTAEVIATLLVFNDKTPDNVKEDPKIADVVLQGAQAGAQDKKEEPAAQQKEETGQAPAAQDKKEEPVDKSSTVDMQKVEDEGKTGLSPDKLKAKAETIIRDSFIPDASEKSDKFKMGANKPGARIVYKDKGESKIEPEELAVLDEYFGQDGFVRVKTKEKRYGTKYVWVKKLRKQTPETPQTDAKTEPAAKPATQTQGGSPAVAQGGGEESDF